MHTPTIRPATEADAAACASIYAPSVERTAVSFETEAPDAAAFAERIRAIRATHEFLVADDGGEVLGYAYAAEFAARAAYRWSCGTSIYLREDARGAGLGRRLYTALLDRLGELGYRRAFGGVTLPNDASVGLHRALGFRQAAHFERVGWKLGAWHDVVWLQRDLGPVGAQDPPEEPG